MIPKSCVSAENTMVIVFSAKHSFADMKGCNLKKNKNLAKTRGCLPNCKKVFFGVCFLGGVFGGFVFFSVFLCFCKKAQKGYLPAILDLVSVLVCSPKRPLFKIVLFLPILFFWVFLLSSLSKFHHVPLLFVHQPLFGKTVIIFGFFYFSCFLPFPFLMFVCFFETNFPNIPFLKPKLLSFLAGYLVLVFFGFYVHSVCFCLSVSMLGLLLVSVLFCFCLRFYLVSCFAFISTYKKKHCFPGKFWCF